MDGLHCHVHAESPFFLRQSEPNLVPLLLLADVLLPLQESLSALVLHQDSRAPGNSHCSHLV
eukprot:3299873-Amphidinium_carterae.1